jgi:hypothetical protein
VNLLAAAGICARQEADRPSTEQLQRIEIDVPCAATEVQTAERQTVTGYVAERPQQRAGGDRVASMHRRHDRLVGRAFDAVRDDHHRRSRHLSRERDPAVRYRSHRLP